VVDIQESRKAIRPLGVESDAFASDKPSSLTFASCDLDLWPLIHKVDRFMSSPVDHLSQICCYAGPG